MLKTILVRRHIFTCITVASWEGSAKIFCSPLLLSGQG